MPIAGGASGLEGSVIHTESTTSSTKDTHSHRGLLIQIPDGTQCQGHVTVSGKSPHSLVLVSFPMNKLIQKVR
jgi:hypothetical protein